MTADSHLGETGPQQDVETKFQRGDPVRASKMWTPVQGFFGSGTTGTLIRQSLRAKGDSILLNLPNPEAAASAAASMPPPWQVPPLSQQAVLAVSSHMTWLGKVDKVEAATGQHTSRSQLETKLCEDRVPLEAQLVGADLASLL
ncbi:SF3A1 [Symbiodinium natans]|uniref:SF3A1 protein n=1 Tax=Symbiodinium natans TaxID=878477 RepID=A0A812UNU9_9DINO|nr:SF3A1 [Symbiodinium natans]